MSTFNVTPIKSYIVDIETLDKIEFQFNPNSITEEHVPIYKDHQIPGRSHPRSQYIGGDVEEISFQTNFFFTRQQKYDVTSKCNFLKSFTYGNKKEAPNKLLFVFGDLYSIICEMRKCKIVYDEIFDPSNLLPFKANLDIVLHKWVEDSVSYEVIRKGQVNHTITKPRFIPTPINIKPDFKIEE